MYGIFKNVRYSEYGMYGIIKVMYGKMYGIEIFLEWSPCIWLWLLGYSVSVNNHGCHPVRKDSMVSNSIQEEFRVGAIPYGSNPVWVQFRVGGIPWGGIPQGRNSVWE